MKHNGSLLFVAVVALCCQTAAADGPQPTVPADNARTIVSTPDLLWSAGDGAWEHDIQIATDPGFATVIDEDRIHAFVQRYVPAEALPAGDCWWRVRSVAREGTCSPWSAAHRLTIDIPKNEYVIPAGSTAATISVTLQTAAGNTPASVRFEPGEYRVAPTDESGECGYLVDLTAVSDLVIDGRGARITGTNRGGFIRLCDCRSVVIRNLFYDHDPVLYGAGQVIAVDRDNRTFDIRILPCHALPEDGADTYYRGKKGMIIDPVARRPKLTGPVTLCRFMIEGWTRVGDNVYRLTAEQLVAGSHGTLRSMDFVAVDDVFQWVSKNGLNQFEANFCDDVTVDGVHFAASGGWTAAIYTSRMKFLNTKFLPVANNHVMEILHFADGRIGPWIENCLLSNSSDDGPVVLNHALPVVKQLAPDRFRLDVRRSLHGLARDEFDRGLIAGRTAGGLLGFRVGDRLKFFTPKPGARSDTYAVAGLAEACDGCLDITLDRSAGSDVRLVPGRETDTCTQVMNLDAKANQTVMRHNRFQFIGRNALVLQADGVLVEHNEFLGIGARAVGINSLGGHPALGATSRDVMIRDNVMRQTSLNPTSREAISIFQLGDPATRWNENIWIVDNQILDYSIVGLSIANATGVHITGNRFGNEVFDAYGRMVWKRPGGEEPCILHIGNAADVRFENNVIAEGRAPPQLVLETGPVDNFVHDHNTVTAPPLPFSFTAPAGPTFTAAEKQAQRDRGTSVMPLVRKAFAAGAESVTIPPGDYRFGKETWGPGGPIYPLDFRGMRRDAEHPFRILAEGVTLWFELPSDQTPHAHCALGFVECSHLSLEGATLDRDPRGCMEGRITQLDDAGNRIEIEATAGTLIPAAFSGELNQRFVPFNADGTFCTALYALQRRPGQLRYRDISPGTQPGRYWVNLDEQSELLKTNRDPAWHRTYGDAGTLQPGDGLSLVYTTATAIGVTDCSNMTFIGLRNYLSKGMVHELRGGGGHVWKDCFFGPRPGTCHWQGSDGFLTGCLERGSTYDGLTMMHTTDDVMNMHGYWGYLETVDGRTITLQRDHQMPAHAGDELTFYDPETGMPAGKALVTAVEGPRITLDRDAAAFASAIAENRRFQCDGWEIRNCTFTDCYQRLLVQGGNGGTLRDSSFTRLGGHISLQSNFFTKNEGGICRNIRIENNSFDRVAIHPDGIPLVADFKPQKRGNTGTVLRDITVCGNRFLHCGSPAIAFGHVDGGLISGNSFERSILPRSAGNAGGPPDPIVLEHCSNIEERETATPSTGAEPAAAALPASSAPRSELLERKPFNVIVVITDDQGYCDVGYTGHPHLKTPQIDDLARRGVQFTQFYAQSVCSPTRAALMTGRDYYRTGVTDTAAGCSQVAADEYTLAEAFHDHGYRTGIFGKWHLGDNHPYRPTDQGFDESVIIRGGMIGKDAPLRGYFDPLLMHNGQPEQYQGYCCDIFTDKAIEFITQSGSNPFFIYLAPNTPHSPRVAPEHYAQPYKDLGLSEETSHYYGMIANIDDNLGRVMKVLADRGLSQNTIIVFLGDNGTPHKGMADHYTGLRGAKCQPYEGGLKVPFLISVPGLAPGQKVDRIASVQDIMPTLLDSCAIPLPEHLKLDGKSLLPLIQGDAAHWPERTLFFQFHRGDAPTRYREVAVRRQRYKIVNHDCGGKPKFQLYDMASDPLEKNDLATQFPEVVASMKSDYDSWFDQIHSERGFDALPIFVGTDRENPVRLTAQSFRRDRCFELDFKSAGPFRITLEFGHPIGQPCPAFVKIGDRTFETKVVRGASQAVFENIVLDQGRTTLHAWRENGQKRVCATVTIQQQVANK
jgi:arylsulfatase A